MSNAAEMDAQEIINYIATVPKKTPVKLYVREKPGMKVAWGDAHVYGGRRGKTVFGDWDELRAILDANADSIDYYATLQLEQVGVLEATWLIDQLKLKDGATGPFNIELFTGSPDDNNAKYFFKGAWDLLQPYFEKGVLVSPSQHGQGGVTKDFTVEDWQKISVMSWKTEQAQKDMESILDSTYAHGEKLDAVLTPYDGIAQGVINAIESKRPDMKPGTDSWPYITGQDAMEIAVANIAKDKQGETVFKDVNKLADAVYDMVVEIAEGKEVSGLNGKFNNNNIDVPSKLLDPQNITKDNLQDLVTANYITQDRFDELTK